MLNGIHDTSVLHAYLIVMTVYLSILYSTYEQGQYILDSLEIMLYLSITVIILTGFL